MGTTRVLALRIERRAVAAAIFRDRHLEYVDGRELATAAPKAEASAVSFVEWLFEQFDIASAAVECPPESDDTVRAGIQHQITSRVRDRGCPVHLVERRDFVSAFALPPPLGRAKGREVVSMVWPILTTQKMQPAKLDAIALGLYVQTERLFHH